MSFSVAVIVVAVSALPVAVVGYLFVATVGGLCLLSFAPVHYFLRLSRIRRQPCAFAFCWKFGFVLVVSAFGAGALQ